MMIPSVNFSLSVTSIHEHSLNFDLPESSFNSVFSVMLNQH